MSGTIFPQGPANHNCIVASGSWSTPIPYSEAAWTYWLSSNNQSVAVNRFVWEVARSCDPDPKNGEVSKDAKFALLRFKLKAWVPSGSVPAMCQANVRAVIPGETSNHLIHVDEWSRGAGNSHEGRRIAYTTAWFPISDADQIIFDVAREISVRGTVEVVAYLEGYSG